MSLWSVVMRYELLNIVLGNAFSIMMLKIENIFIYGSKKRNKSPLQQFHSNKLYYITSGGLSQ